MRVTCCNKIVVLINTSVYISYFKSQNSEYERPSRSGPSESQFSLLPKSVGSAYLTHVRYPRFTRAKPYHARHGTTSAEQVHACRCGSNGGKQTANSPGHDRELRLYSHRTLRPPGQIAAHVRRPLFWLIAGAYRYNVCTDLCTT